MSGGSPLAWASQDTKRWLEPGPSDFKTVMCVTHAYIVDADEKRSALLARRLRTLAHQVEMRGPGMEELCEAHGQSAVALVASEQAEPILKGLRNADIGMPTIIYAEQPIACEIVCAIEAGALDYLHWPVSKKRLARAVQRAGNRDDPKVRAVRRRSAAKTALRVLSPREIEVLRHLVAGRTSKEIGRELQISPRTVEIHRRNLLAKLNATASADAVRLGVYAGMDSGVDLPTPDLSNQIFAAASDTAGG
jgi:two-component system, LuxR family, response regulator FixJ